jgi:hypothetical protein
MDEKGTPTWQEKFPAEAIDKLKRDSFDFYGEYMCDPQRGENKFFPIDRLEQDMRNAREATKEMLGVKYWGQYTPNHRYGIGSDHSEGIGLDSNAFCVFDFKTGELVARYANNKIAPDLHAHECMRVGGEFGNCVWAMEVNNKCGGTVLTTANNQSYPRIFKMTKNGEVTTKQGWETTKASKTQMLMEFRTAYIDGDIKIYDMDLLMEMKSFTNTDLTDSNDTGLLTRHFDLLMSACIAWQTNPQAEEKRQEQYTPLEAPSFYRLRSYP